MYYAGIDYHKRYSVVSIQKAQGQIVQEEGGKVGPRLELYNYWGLGGPSPAASQFRGRGPGMRVFAIDKDRCARHTLRNPFVAS